MNLEQEIFFGKLFGKSNKEIATDIFSKLKNTPTSQHILADIKKDKELVNILDKSLNESTDFEKTASFLVQGQASSEEEKDKLEIISLVTLMIYVESKK